MSFSKELTVNDIIQAIKNRKKYIRENTGDPIYSEQAYIRISELDALLNYIENDEDYV